MLRLPRRCSHSVFGVRQSGLTSGIAGAIASLPANSPGAFALHWSTSWLIAWGVMLPVVIFAAPLIRRMAMALTGEA
ncbi:DUF2798 domain-containing protein [Bosea sp. 124]|uniref:DUF2798 domain-containing protein n=1 Tax=Bosea sp. 124 TaxID=2135642 RepID=UPI000D38D844|nr:DUF2798 domain-containing protein [Bosea sp. 124]PTM43506.1 uncharacterized protein DUF2798 [Bosea sp. 124]